MIERVVLIKLKDEFANRDARRDIAVYSKDRLKKIEHVVDVLIGVPADERSEKDWDLYLIVQLDAAENIEDYVQDFEHRKYVDEFLKPKMEIIKAWNFRQIDVT